MTLAWVGYCEGGGRVSILLQLFHAQLVSIPCIAWFCVHSFIDDAVAGEGRSPNCICVLACPLHYPSASAATISKKGQLATGNPAADGLVWPSQFSMLKPASGSFLEFCNNPCGNPLV